MTFPIVHIEDVCEVNPKKSKSIVKNTEVSFLAMADVSESGEIINHRKRLYDEVQTGFTTFENSDILVAKITPCFENGKGALANNLINGFGFGSTEFHVIRANDKILPKYLFYITRSQRFKKEGEKNMTGSAGQKRIPASFIKKFKIPLPPLPVQQQIADTLDKADALRRKDQELLQKYDHLAQAIFYEMFGDPINNSIGWETALLSEKTECITKGESPNWQGYEYQEEGILFVTSENVGQGKLILEGKTKYIPHKFHEKLKRSQLKEEDVLINLVGASIGRCTVFKNQKQPANINQAVALIRCCTNEILPDYLSFLLRTDHMQRIIKGDIVESARANISLNDINNYRIIVPPIEIQKKFVKVIEISRNQVKLIEKMPELFNVLLAETI